MKIKDIINFKIEKEIKERYKAITILIYFLLIMIGLTLLSRFSDSLTIPKVKTTNGTRGTIDHEISGEGIIYQNSSKSITLIEGLKIDSIYVSEGTLVNEGDTLLTLDMDALNDILNSCEKEFNESQLAYNRAVEDQKNAESKINKQISDVKIAMDKAQNDMNNASEEEREQYSEEYETKKSEYNELINSKDETLLSYKRAVEDAKNQDNSEVSEKIKKLTELKNAGGKVTSPTSGTVIEINVERGGTTQGGSVLALSNSESENLLTVQISKDNRKSVKVGQKVDVAINDDSTYITNLKIENIKVNSENSDMLDVTVKLPVGQGTIGEYGKMTVPSEDKEYDVILPLEAIHQDGDKYYVLVVNDKDTVLGSQKIASKVEVTIADKNGESVALKDYAISSYDEVIISSNKDIQDGDRIRKDDK